MRPLVEPHLQNLVPYVPGKPIEETEREYGITGIAKLASNENALGASPLALEAAHKALAHTHLYPDAGGFYLKQRLVKLHASHDVTERNIVLGNGTNEIINLLVRAFVGPGEALLNAWPSFVCYRLAARACGREEIAVPLDDTLGYDLPAMAKAAQQRGQGSVQQVGGPGAQPDLLPMVSEIRESLNNVRRDLTNSYARQQQGGGAAAAKDCPTPTCVTGLTVALLLGGQLILLLGYLMYRDSREASAKKFY